MIEGLQVVPLRRIPDERGTVFHMLRASDPHFRQFGEIYFSSVYRDAIKGWHRHREMTLNYACVWGRVKLVIFDDREASVPPGRARRRSSSARTTTRSWSYRPGCGTASRAWPRCPSWPTAAPTSTTRRARTGSIRTPARLPTTGHVSTSDQG